MASTPLIVYITLGPTPFDCLLHIPQFSLGINPFSSSLFPFHRSCVQFRAHDVLGSRRMTPILMIVHPKAFSTRPLIRLIGCKSSDPWGI